MPKNVPKSIQTYFERLLGQIFRKVFAQFSTEGRLLENFQKNQKVFKISKTFKITKMPKIVPKIIQTCFEPILGQIFRNFFCAVFDGGSRLRKISKKIQKFSKFQKCPKSFPKVSKRVLNVFWGKLFEKFLPNFPWKVESSKIFKKNQTFQISKNFQNIKNAQKRSIKYPNVF